MKQRMNYGVHIQEPVKILAQLSHMLEELVGPTVASLTHHRASQLNGCAFCLDMDVKKAKLRGESELRMYHIAVWRDSQLFNAKERAALEWTEYITEIPRQGIPNEVYERAREHFSEKELSALTFFLGTVNAWNRLNVAFCTTPGQLDTLYGLDKAGLK